jgi:hypothetical protein
MLSGGQTFLSVDRFVSAGGFIPAERIDKKAAIIPWQP